MTIRVCAGVMWPGVEPTRGNYNASYLSTMRGITDQLASYNIYTLVDMHQDCLSEKFCGEGVPLYAADTTGTELLSLFGDTARNLSRATGAAGFPLPFQKTPYPVDSNGVPPAANCSQHSWSEYQATEAASLAYQNIYSNVSGLQDRFGMYWQKVAAAFKTSEFVIGYEVSTFALRVGRAPPDLPRLSCLAVNERAVGRYSRHCAGVERQSMVPARLLTCCCESMTCVACRQRVEGSAPHDPWRR